MIIIDLIILRAALNFETASAVKVRTVDHRLLGLVICAEWVLVLGRSHSIIEAMLMVMIMTASCPERLRIVQTMMMMTCSRYRFIGLKLINYRVCSGSIDLEAETLRR